MENKPFSDPTADLLVAVERLSTQDQRRIVRLIALLSRASDELREQTQRLLCELIARAPETHASCLWDIDEIIGQVEQRLEMELHLAAAREQARRFAGEQL